MQIAELEIEKEWVAVAQVDAFVSNGGQTVLYGEKQIAIFNFNMTDWYAVDNQCPHKKQNILARGLVGNSCDVRKVACPLHKHTFDLETGTHLGGNADWTLTTYEVEVKNGLVYLFLNKLV